MGAAVRLNNLSTKLPYRAFPSKHGGQQYAVFMNVQFSLCTSNAPRTKKIECIVDSGASSCLFHADIAKFLSLDLKAGLCDITNGIGGPEEVWIHDVMLYLPGGPVKIAAGFKEGLSVAGLLGMKGFFEHFKITFDSAALECTLDRIFQA